MHGVYFLFISSDNMCDCVYRCKRNVIFERGGLCEAFSDFCHLLMHEIGLVYTCMQIIMRKCFFTTAQRNINLILFMEHIVLSHDI